MRLRFAAGPRSTKILQRICCIAGCFVLLLLWHPEERPLWQSDSFIASQVKDIDLLQTQMLDYLNGELTFDSAFGGSLTGLSQFDVVSTWAQIWRYSHSQTQVTTISEARRVCRSLLVSYKLLFEQQAAKIKTKELETVIEKLTGMAYSWISPKYKSIRDLQLLFSGDRKENQKTGIVMCVGTKHIEFALHAITSLRNVLDCGLPIEIHYAGPNDLKPEMIHTLSWLPNVQTVNLMDHFPLEMVSIEGWSVKPFAILASSFSEIIFMDADVLFFKNPEVVLKESAIFSEYGQLFFHDRSLEVETAVLRQTAEWFKEINPFPSTYAASLRFTNSLSYHEQESGVLLVDKSQTGVLHSLLLACLLNSKQIRNETYSHAYGDKETFWISWELLRVPYQFAPMFPGVVGFIDPPSSDQENMRSPNREKIAEPIPANAVCGNLLHFDESKNPFWWNSGVLHLKEKSDSWLLKMDQISFEKERGSMKWERLAAVFCLMPKHQITESRQLSANEKTITESYIHSYRRLKEIGWQKYCSLALEEGIDLDQTRALDFFMGESTDAINTETFGGSLAGLDEFDLLSTCNRIVHYCLHYDLKDPNFIELKKQSRCLLIAHFILNTPSKQSHSIEDLTEIINKHTLHAYPWLSKSIEDLRKSFSNNKSGIVLTSGTEQLESTIHTITALRKVLNCSLNIEVYYVGEKDLESNHVQLLQQMPNVQPINLLALFPTELHTFYKYSIKPFAILASSFQNVIFMDSDVLFLLNPEVILEESDIFRNYGQLFFHDRSLQKDYFNQYASWFKAVNPHYSYYASKLRFSNCKSYHEQESGVVAVDKSRAGVLHALILACKLNSNSMREDTYKAMYGDKETFWISWELTRVPFKFAPSLGGTIGYERNNAVCGSLVHVDERKRLFWWNGGMRLIKTRPAMGLVRFEKAALDYGVVASDNWVWETDTEPFCLLTNDETRAADLSDSEKDIGMLYIELWQRLESEGLFAFITAEFGVFA
ncbi:mannosyltransferase putative-domain-containing protein [Obelidium mucronatum]|nr:mannosyltransferase putative-domain-containing protein [Obelidium mucronatum]